MDEKLQQSFDQIIDQLVEQTLDAPPFATLTRPEYEHKKNQINDYFHNLIVETLFENLNETQMTEAEQLDFSSPEAASKFSLWAAEIPNFLFIYEQKLNQVSAQIKQTGHIPTDE